MGMSNIQPWDVGDEIVHSSKDMVWCSLHHHGTFSYLDGFGTPEEHAARAAEIGMNALAMTDHGNVSSHVRLEQAGNKHGVKPIFGCELYTGGVGEDDKTQRKNHLTVLAEDVNGYQNLLRIVSEAWARGFYYEPTADGAMLRMYGEGLIVLSGCLGSLLATSLIGGKNISEDDASLERGSEVARRFKRTFQDRYYLEVQAFPELEKTKRVNAAIAEISERQGIPLVATMDAHYMRPEEAEMQAILQHS